MKTRKSFQISLTLSAALLLSGCAGTDGTEIQEKSNKTSSGYLESRLDIKKDAEKMVGDAVQKKNQELTDAMKDSGVGLEYVEKYSGAVLKTNKGDIVIKFYNDDSPRTVDNFLKLASQNFYNDIKFHRVIKDFMIQTGDPNSKDDQWADDGMGGPGYTFPDEFNSHPLVRGSLAMANSGPNTNGSQFFIVTADATPWLNGKHTNFGEVTEGMEVVEAIENAEANEKDHPLDDIVIESVELIEK